MIHLMVNKSPGIGVMMSYESTSHSVAPSMVHEEVVIICKSQLKGFMTCSFACAVPAWFGEVMQGYGSNPAKPANSRAKSGHASRPSNNVLLSSAYAYGQAIRKHTSAQPTMLCSSIVHECRLPVPCAASEDMGAAMTEWILVFLQAAALSCCHR